MAKETATPIPTQPKVEKAPSKSRMQSALSASLTAETSAVKDRSRFDNRFARVETLQEPQTSGASKGRTLSTAPEDASSLNASQQEVLVSKGRAGDKTQSEGVSSTTFNHDRPEHLQDVTSGLLQAGSSPNGSTSAPNTSHSQTSAGTATVIEEGKGEQRTLSNPTSVVRDSFTMPQNDYALIAATRQRCLAHQHSVTKAEVLRAGLLALERLSDDQLLDIVTNLEKVKTGRPTPRGKS